MHCLLDAFSLVISLRITSFIIIYITKRTLIETSTQVDDEGDLEVEMLMSVIPENFQEIGNQILNKCAKQGESRLEMPFIHDNYYFIIVSRIDLFPF